MSSRIALWVIAVCLVVLVAGGGIYFFTKQHAQNQRDKYRDQAQLACTLTGNIPPGDENLSLSELRADPAYQQCVSDQIDTLVATDGNPYGN